MVSDDIDVKKEFAEALLDMKLRDFFVLCAEKGIDFSLVVSALTVCSFKLLCQLALDKKNNK